MSVPLFKATPSIFFHSTPSFFFFKDFIFPFSPQSPQVHSCVFLVVGPSSCAMWDAASPWPDEWCYVHAQDSNWQNPGPPKGST